MPLTNKLGLAWNGITFRYSETAKRPTLEDFSLHLGSGQIHLLTGPSGCGKSTLLYLAAGLYPEHGGILDSGTVTLNGQPLDHFSSRELAEHIRVVFQNLDLQFCMQTVDQELTFVLENIGTPPADMCERIAEVLSDVGLQGFEDRTIHTLSGGEKQRVGIAAGLLGNPRWLLLDEILAQVDPDVSLDLVRLIADISKKRNISVLVVDHHLDYWQDVTESIFLLDQDGRLSAVPSETRGYTPEDWAAAGVIARGVSYPSIQHEALDTEPLLVAQDLTVERDGIRVLESIHATIRPGQMIALTGKSGVGKTTLLTTLAGALPFTGLLKGSLIGKRRIFRRTYHTEGIRFLFQNPQDQFVGDTVSQELLFSLKHRYPDDPETQESEARRLLHAHALWSRRRYAPFQLSEGQQRRLAVISLLAESSQLLLCDEPCYAQDLRNVIAIMTELSHATQRGTAVIFTTHDPKLVTSYATDVWHLQDGRLHVHTP